MKQHRIYTAGRMTGLSSEEQIAWRLHLESELMSMKTHGFTVIIPTMYYDPNDPDARERENEAKEWDLSQIANCDIVVVNLDGIEKSIGTHYELGFIDALRRSGKTIYVIGVGGKKDLHPWIANSLFRWEPDIEAAAVYIAQYLFI